MEKGVNEKDWKLFRSRLPGWQETYMESLQIKSQAFNEENFGGEKGKANRPPPRR